MWFKIETSTDKSPFISVDVIKNQFLVRKNEHRSYVQVDWVKLLIVGAIFNYMTSLDSELLEVFWE